MLLTKKIKINPNKQQIEFIEFCSNCCKNIWNCALSQSMFLYRQYRYKISVYEQKKQLVEFKKQFPEYKLVYNKNLSEVLFRLEKAFKRVKKGKCVSLLLQQKHSN